MIHGMEDRDGGPKVIPKKISACETPTGSCWFPDVCPESLLKVLKTSLRQHFHDEISCNFYI